MRANRSHFGFGGRHKTPKRIDHLFSREVITEDNYKEFWPRFWKAHTEREQNKIIAEFSGVAVVTQKRAEAEFDAKRLSEDIGEKFVVRRRNSKGQFSKRGKRYQAIRVTRGKENEE